MVARNLRFASPSADGPDYCESEVDKDDDAPLVANLFADDNQFPETQVVQCAETQVESPEADVYKRMHYISLMRMIVFGVFVLCVFLVLCFLNQLHI